MSVEVQPQTAETLQTIPRPEEDPNAKVIVFEDERGIERRPHPEAAECYASEEVQAEVSRHMMEVDRGLDEVSARLEVAVNPDAERETGFAVLTADLLERVKTRAKAQMPGLTEKQTLQQERQVTKGRFFFKRTETELVSVEVDAVKPGMTLTAADKRMKKGWSSIDYQVSQKGKYLSEESVPDYEQKASDMLEELLVGEERDIYDPQGERLPLLAKKIQEAGLSDEQIDELDWAAVEAMLPEAKEWFEGIHTLDDSLSYAKLWQELSRIQSDLIDLSPIACQTIATIYYDDEMLQKLSDMYDQAKARYNEVYAQQNPGDVEAFKPGELYERQVAAISKFFENAFLADTILTHGTPFIPRVIKSGALKPAANMEADEFTFNTHRTNIANASAVSSINGSMSIHLSGPSNKSYARDEVITEDIMRTRLARTLGVKTDHPWIDQELAKGGLGAGRLVIRLGDAIQRTAFGGTPEASYGHDDRITSQQRKGVVELTPAGYEKVKDQLITDIGPDVAFITAPQSHPNEELFDYEYPIEEMMIGIPSRDPDTIPNALRARGWTEEQIAEHTYMYDDHVGESQELQDKVLQQGKYARSVVVPVAVES